MPHIQAAATDQPARSDLINFLKAIPDSHDRREVLYTQWFLLPVALRGILSYCRSCRDL